MAGRAYGAAIRTNTGGVRNGAGVAIGADSGAPYRCGVSSITADFCAGLAGIAGRPLTPPVRDAARRSLLNVVATAVGASRTPAVDIAVRHAAAHGGTPVAPVPGRAERLDLTGAALVTGIAAHLDDFDDTHLATVIHPGAATLATVVPLGVRDGAAADDVLRAFALGCEAQLRLGNAVSPGHYDAGWHITGTCGVVGAAVAAAVLRGLDASGLAAAVALAATQTVGHREAFGSMTKAFHPGKAAANGLVAALLAERGYASPEAVFERDGGFFAAFTPEAHPDALLDGLGEAWELEKNAFKPYPCGIVSHPLIDAAVAASSRVPDTAQVREIHAHCHPLVPELMGRIQPEDGLQARFSAAHTIAAGLADGQLTLRQFADDRVVRDDVRGLRAAVRFLPDEEWHRDEATLEIVLADGTTVTEHVEHARGSLDRPLTDEELEDKARNLIEDVLPGRTDAIIAATELTAPDGLTTLVRTMTPGEPA